MKPLKYVNSAEAALTFRNIMWSLPYLAIIGSGLGYSSHGASGAIVGLLIAVVVSAVIGSAASVFTGRASSCAVNVFYGLGRITFGVRDPDFPESVKQCVNVVRMISLAM